MPICRDAVGNGSGSGAAVARTGSSARAHPFEQRFVRWEPLGVTLAERADRALVVGAVGAQQQGAPVQERCER